MFYLKLNPSEFISKAEGLKSWEINTRQKLESIRSERSSIQSQIETLEYRLDSLYMELESLQDDEDEETDNSAAIASVRAEISSTQEEISDYEAQDAELSIEESKTEEELRQIELEEQETLADIQDSAIRTNKNITLISSFGGDYANVSAQATNSFQHNLGQLSQAAQILGGSVSMGVGGISGGLGATTKNPSEANANGRNFYEAANNQRNNSSTHQGSFGAKVSSGNSNKGHNTVVSNQEQEEHSTHKTGGLGKKPSNIAEKNTALADLADYMATNNYGKDDFATYSQDPAWQALHQKAYPELYKTNSSSKNSDKQKEHRALIGNREDQISSIILDVKQGSNKSISRKEAEAMLDSIQDYSGSYYSEIRDAYNNPDASPRLVQAMNNVDSYIRGAVKWEGTTYRGINVSRETANKILSDPTIDMLGPASWSSSENIAQRFSIGAESVRMVFVLGENKSGASITHIATYNGSEKEVLSPSGVQYIADSVQERNIDGQSYVYVNVHEQSNDSGKE